MEQNNTRATFEGLGDGLLDCLTALHALSGGLSGLGGLMFGLVEIASHSEISGESLTVIMEKLYEYSDMAGKAEETLLKMRRPVS